MAFTSEAAGTRNPRTAELSWDDPHLDREAQPPRDWKKLFLVIGLGGLSWVATFVGMLELIEANMGDLPLVHKGIIGFSVAMLMVMVVWLLDQMFSDIGWFTRSLYAAGYVFLTVISVGFGFGFYWKVLESRSEASRSAESAVGQVQTSLHAAMTRLEQLQGTLDSLTTISTHKAETERASGTSCPNSKPGDGPRRKMRDEDAARFKFASDFVKGRVETVKGEMTGLDADLVKIVKDDKTTVDAKSGTRNEFMKSLGRKLDMTVTGFNAFRTDPQLKQIRADLNERADKATFMDTKGGTYTCPDGQLTTALKGVVRAIDELPALEKPKIAAVEGSEAVIEAFRRLTATFYGALAFKLPPSPEELRELQKRAVQSVENASAAQARLTAMADQAGLSKRDYVPLAIAIFVDLCLLLVSMRKGGSRLQSLVPKMRAAERGPVIQILSRFNEIHRDKQIRENFEVFRHVVFDFHGDYYAAVPLNAPYRPNPAHAGHRQGYGVSDAQDLLQEAHLLANLFASFEKERIFTRVHSPLLSTRTVQKRLRRQGSKFANSEAFRIYRFRNGAWSEIILGAVMGAARRVEAEQRRRRVEEDTFRADPTRREPIAMPMPAPAPMTGYAATAPAPFPHPQARPVPQPFHGLGDTGHRDHASPAAVASVAPFPAPPPRPSPRAPAARGASEPSSAYSMSREPQAWPRPDLPPPEKPVIARPANSNTAPYRSGEEGSDAPAQAWSPAPMPALAENVVLHPAVGRTPASGPAGSGPAGPGPVGLTEGALARAIDPIAPERTMTVEAKRETVTYTVPVSEAAIPPALLAMLARADRASGEQQALDDASASAEPVIALPPPLPAARASISVASPIEAAVIDLSEAAATHSVQGEVAAWTEADEAGFEAEQSQALSTQDLADETRAIAARLRPDHRGG